jgi:hypothetical protein
MIPLVQPDKSGGQRVQSIVKVHQGYEPASLLRYLVLFALAAAFGHTDRMACCGELRAAGRSADSSARAFRRSESARASTGDRRSSAIGGLDCAHIVSGSQH